MKKNMGNADRIIRVIISAIMLTLYFTHTVTGAIGIILVIFSVVFIGTSLISFCPLYTLIGASTCAINKK